jgi:mannose-1-phosphate guanylyltransferase
MAEFYAVIMAGGGGTRLWPLSRAERPKQALDLIGGRTLFEMAVKRLAPLVPHERILVVTVAQQVELLRRQARQLRAENFLLEPAPRGTAAVVGLAAVALMARDPDAVMAVLPADHYVGNPQALRDLLVAGAEAARAGHLVTLGITPSYPATGYGYIQRAELLGEVRGFPLYRVRQFHEKPDLPNAKRYLEEGGFYWNSGMFLWKAQRILQEIERWMPDLREALREVEGAWESAQAQQVLRAVWQDIVPQTVDYGIMERADDVAVLPADDLEWCDIGSWSRLFDVLEKDEQGNVHHGDKIMALDSHGNLIWRGEGSGQRLLVLLGVQDMVLVETSDAILICPREEAERVREVVRVLGQSPEGGRYL